RRLRSGSGASDTEDGVARRDAEKLRVGRLGGDALEERRDLESPLVEIGPQEGRLLAVAELDGAEGLAASPEAELAAAHDAQIPDPLRLTARRDEVLCPLVDQEVHGNRPPLAALPSPDGQDARSVDADPQSRE